MSTQQSSQESHDWKKFCDRRARDLTALAEMCRGSKVADAVVIYGSVDTCMGEVDR